MACILQVQTHVPSTMVAVLISVYSALTIQETIHVPVTMEHNFIRMDVTVLVRQL